MPDFLRRLAAQYAPTRAAPGPAASAQALIDQWPHGIAVFDAARRLVGCNARLGDLLGLPQALLRPGLPFDAIVEHHRTLQPAPGTTRAGLLMLDGQVPKQPRRFERVMPHGQRVEIEATALPEGGLSLSVHEARARTAAQLPACDNLMETADAAGMFRAVSWDDQYRCRQANAAFARSVRVARDSLPGRRLSDLLDDATRERLLPHLAAALGGEPRSFEEALAGAQGDTAHWLHRFIPEGTPDPATGRVAGVIHVAENVTAVRLAQAQAAQAERARSEFVANISHELRTPFNAVLGVLQVLAGSGLNPRQADLVGKAMGASRSLLSVMGDMIDFTRIESGQLSLEHAPFEIEAVLQDLGVILAQSAEGKDIEVVFDIDPQIPGSVLGDRARFAQLLLHLGSNAIKFTATGTVALRIRLAHARSDCATLDVEVQDTGIGMDARQLAQVMKGYGQGEGASTRRFAGNGLGLTICRHLLRLMGSTLQARSEPGAGSCFGFRIELALDPQAPVAAPEPAGSMRLLIADGNEIARTAHASMARAMGWHVQEVADEAGMLQALRESRHLRAVLVDWRLGGGEPFAALRRQAGQRAHASLVWVASGGTAGQRALSQLPADQQALVGAYLLKPATAGLIARAVAQAQENPAAIITDAQWNASLPLAGLRLLIAEDNVNNQLVARELLTRQGAEIDIAVDGLDTLTSLVANGQYDAVLMDWQMPTMDGLEATREIRHIVGFEHIPIIALTANATAEDRARCLEAGMDDHVAKPLDIRELTAVILRHTRPKQAQAWKPEVAPDARAIETAFPELEALALDAGDNTGGVMTLEAALAMDYEEPMQDFPPLSLVAQLVASDHGSDLVVDQPSALERLGDSDALYSQLVTLFREDGPAMLDGLATALRDGTRSEARRLAHTLKGTAGTVGACLLERASQAAEDIFLEAASPADAVALDALQGAMRRTLAALPA